MKCLSSILVIRKFFPKHISYVGIRETGRNRPKGKRKYLFQNVSYNLMAFLTKDFNKKMRQNISIGNCPRVSLGFYKCLPIFRTTGSLKLNVTIVSAQCTLVKKIVTGTSGKDKIVVSRILKINSYILS